MEYEKTKKSLNITHPTLNNQINLHMSKILCTFAACFVSKHKIRTEQLEQLWQRKTT